MSPADIRDIRGPIPIPYVWLPFAIAVAAIAAIAIAALVYRSLRRRSRQRAKTAAEIALDRIERARTLVGTVSSAELSAEVSDAIRAYLEAVFSLRAAHRTTEEFLHDLLEADRSPIREHRAALWEFLSWCDLAKFARFHLENDHAGSLIDTARRFVESTASPGEPTPRPKDDHRPVGPTSVTSAEAGT